jgi:hypothetical protein
MPLPNISPKLLKAYQEEIAKRTSPATAKRKASSLRRFFSWAHQEGHIDENPLTQPSSSIITQPPEKPKPSFFRFSNILRFAGLAGLVVLVFLLAKRAQIPIPWRPAPATEEEIAQQIPQPTPLPQEFDTKAIIAEMREEILKSIGDFSINWASFEDGNLLIGGAEVSEIALSTADTSDGDITINPDGSGIAHFLFEGTSSNFLNAQAPNLIDGSLYYGIVANNATEYDLIKLQSGSKPITRFSVDALGNTYIGQDLNVEGDISTDDTPRLTSEGELTNITGYTQTEGNFSITQTAGGSATIIKKASALSDLMVLTLDERDKPKDPNSIYSTLVLNRYYGSREAMALFVDEGNARFDGQLQFGRFASNPADAIGEGSIIYNTGDDTLYYYTASGWTQISTGGGASVWQRISGILSPLVSTDDLAIGGTDSTASFFVNDSGTITFSSDTNLYRSAADTLATDDSLTIGSDLAVNGGNITSTGNLTLNATSTVIIPDADTFQTNDITNAGTITIDSGGTVQLGTDDDFLPQLDGGDANIGASGTRWDNIYAVAGNFSGTVTANDFSCTDCLDFTEFANNMTLDEATDIALGALTLSISGTGALDFNSTGQVSFAGNVDAENGLDVTGANLTVGSGSEFSVDVSTGNITTAGDLAVNGGDITSTASTFNFVNSGVSILNIGGAASTVSIGASTGTTTVNDELAVSGGDITGVNGAALDLGEANTGDVTVTGDLLPVDDNTYDLGSVSLRWQDMYVVNLNVSSTNIAGTTSETFTIDTDDTGGDLSYIFGTALDERLTWDASSDGDTGLSGTNQFELTDTLGVSKTGRNKCCHSLPCRKPGYRRYTLRFNRFHPDY